MNTIFAVVIILFALFGMWYAYIIYKAINVMIEEAKRGD